MPSPALLRHRASTVGHFYVITSVVASRRPVFADPACAELLISQFRGSDSRGLTRSFAWVVMPDHFHWVMQLREGTLGRRVQSLKSRAAIALNARLGRHQAVWQRGYYDHWIRDERDVRHQVMYVLGNPVRAGLACRLGGIIRRVGVVGRCCSEGQSSKLDSTARRYGAIEQARRYDEGGASITYPSRPLSLARYSAASAPSTKWWGCRLPSGTRV